MMQLNIKKSPFLVHFNSLGTFMDTLHEFIFPKKDKDPEYYEREEEEVIPEKDNSSFVTRTNEAIEALLQLSPKQSESNVADVSGGDVDDGGAEDGGVEDGDVVGELDEFCHVDLVLAARVSMTCWRTM